HCLLRHPASTLFPYTTLFRSRLVDFEAGRSTTDRPAPERRTRSDRNPCPGRYEEGGLHPDGRRQTQGLVRLRSVLRRLGDLSHEGVAGGPGPDLRVANAELVRTGHPALERRWQD